MKRGAVAFLVGGAAGLCVATVQGSPWVTRTISRATSAIRSPDAPPKRPPPAVAQVASISVPIVAVSITPVTVSPPPGASSSAAPEAPETPEEEAPKDEKPAPPPGPELLALYKEVWVYAQPSFRSRKIGYLRAGSVVSRDAKAAGFGGCEHGFYRVAPQGYVCAGAAASIHPEGPLATLAKRKPDRKQGLPYPYVMSKFPTPPLYLKLPTAHEQRSVEGDLGKHVAATLKKGEAIPAALEATGIPPELADGKVVPSLTPNHHGAGALYAGRAFPKSGFALLATYEHEGRLFGLNTDLQLLPLDRTRVVTPSRFHGEELGDLGLPVAFVRTKGARYYQRDPQTGAMKDDGPVFYREAVQLTGKSERIDKATYLEARDGRYIVQSESLVRIDPPKELPQFAAEGKKWIDVSILKQSLVAWEGGKPVYATLVSTGADGLGDPKETHSTVRGAFLIHTKHVSVTMDNDQEDDRFDLRDVPYVQYFHEGYALHAAYWHDDFGRPKSHGCVNLHPTDAAWLFGWTTPEVPEGFHGAMTLKNGTVVYIHPLVGWALNAPSAVSTRPRRTRAWDASYPLPTRRRRSASCPSS